MLGDARRPEDAFGEKGGSGGDMKGDTVGGTAGDALLEGGAPWQRHMPLRGLQPKGDLYQSKNIPVDKP